MLDPVVLAENHGRDRRLDIAAALVQSLFCAAEDLFSASMRV
jgi:hypothetical protein